ncbi:MAG: hypothetical protein V3V95_00315 [Thermodesulfobacteriota bacterium]
MAWLIFFAFWIVFLWLYKYSERNKRVRAEAMQGDRQSDYSLMKGEFDESMGSFNAPADFKTRLAHIDKAIESLKQMEEILPGKEQLSKKLPELLSLKQALTYSDIKEQFENVMKKAREAKMLIAKVNYATSAQSILNEGLELGIEEKTLVKEIDEVNNYINRIQYDEYLSKAKKEEGKGNIKMAIDQYQVALYFLKMTNMGGDEQGSLVKEIEEKIQGLFKGDEDDI